MNKGELIYAVVEQTGLSQKMVDEILSATLETIMATVSNGDKVSLSGFGSFESRDRKAREGRNPSTGESLHIPATTVPAFSAGKAFKQKVAS